MNELLQAVGMLSTVGALALICWCGHRQDQRRRAEEKARREAAIQEAKARVAADWLDLRRQINALPDDFKTEED